MCGESMHRRATSQGAPNAIKPPCVFTGNLPRGSSMRQTLRGVVVRVERVGVAPLCPRKHTPRSGIVQWPGTITPRSMIKLLNPLPALALLGQSNRLHRSYEANREAARA